MKFTRHLRPSQNFIGVANNCSYGSAVSTSSVAMTPPAYNEPEETHFYDKHVTIGPREKVFVRV